MPGFLKLSRAIAVSLSTSVLVGAIAVLAIDSARGSRTADALAERMRLAEEAARLDPGASDTLEAEVARQTASSLARSARQRTSAIVALSAGGLCLLLLKSRPDSQSPLPANVVNAVARRSAVPPIAGASSEVKLAEKTRSVQARRASECASQPAKPRVSAKHDQECATSQSAGELDTGRASAIARPPVDLAAVQVLINRVGREQHHLIPLLHALSEHYRYLPPAACLRLAELTEIPYWQVTEVASFYPQFRTRPRGKHSVEVCRGTACHVAGADRIYEELRRLLRIPASDDTDADGHVTIETVGCLGCCTLAPVIRVDGRIAGHADVDSLPGGVAWDDACRLPGGNGELAAATAGKHNGTGYRPPFAEFRVGLGSCCVAGGSRDVLVRLQQEISAAQIDAIVTPVGCVGICHMTPLVEIVMPDRESLVAMRVTPADVPQLIRALPADVYGADRWRRRLPAFWQSRPAPAKLPESPCRICPHSDGRLRAFTDPQVRIVTEHSGLLDPTSLEQYRGHEGFAAWERCLRERQPQAIIQAIEQSGLRGRGGAGYPTAAKWRKLWEATGEKFLVCNGDEGDPGAFMDRMIMESYPYRVLEGMAIAAYAVGAQRAFVYVRHEYPLAVRRLRHAVDRMTRAGLLGDQLLGTEFSLHVEVVEGAGAFVCGEETALLQSIMGRRGTPRLRPPYPVERGLFDCPTLVNNVETFANVPWILRHGADRFAALGTATSKGTKVFSLAGKIRRGGLIEIPLGLTIREVVEHIGGGVAEGKRFKAVQIGGPSGGCVPAELADTPIDYEHLQQVGAMLGSGGLVVLDNDDCMVDVARYFLEFTQRESCGHCTFCRVGTRKLLNILERLCSGRGRPKDLDEIESLGRAVSLGSLCGLGKTAPNPVLSTLKYFREEYQAHLQGRCPAGRCKALIRYEVTRDCVGCTLCAQHCPVGAIVPTPYRQHVIDAEICTRCDACRVHCPEQAIQVV